MLTLTRQIAKTALRTASERRNPLTRPKNIPQGLKTQIESYSNQLSSKSLSALPSGFSRANHVSLPYSHSKLSAYMIRSFSSASSSPESQEELATVNWILKNGDVKPITEKVGMNLLEIAHKHGIDLEGACEASLACSTCHIIVEDPDVFETTGEISDEENDMLDLAFGLTQTSRLGCQVKLSKELDGMYVRLPSATRNMMVDGHVPKPH